MEETGTVEIDQGLASGEIADITAPETWDECQETDIAYVYDYPR